MSVCIAFQIRGEKMKDFTVIIPVRDITTGELIHKDCLPFADSNLLINKIRQLKRIKDIHIVVSTDNDVLADMAYSEGVEVQKRPYKYSLDNINFGDFVKHTCSQLTTEHVMWTCVTSPLVNTNTYLKAIDLYKSKICDGFDSLVSVQKLQRYLMDDNGALNFRTDECFQTHNLPKMYIFTNGIAIAQRENMIKWKSRIGDIPYKMELGKIESIDICDKFDYECAKFFGENGLKNK